MQPFYPDRGQDTLVPSADIPPLTDALEAIEQLNNYRGKARDRYLQFISIRLGMTPHQLLDLADSYNASGDCHE